MSLTISQMLLDSEKLASRLKEDDTAADLLISQTQSVYKEIDAMKQFTEETSELNNLARQRPHAALVAGIQQESRHLRELEQENKELRAALEEHQHALELIMSKYRKQCTTLIEASKIDLTQIPSQLYSKVKVKHSEKINEMAACMKSAADIDEISACKTSELLTKLAIENQGLREMLNISYKYGSITKPSTVEKLVNGITEDMNKTTSEDSKMKDQFIKEAKLKENHINDIKSTVFSNNDAVYPVKDWTTDLMTATNLSKSVTSGVQPVTNGTRYEKTATSALATEPDTSVSAISDTSSNSSMTESDSSESESDTTVLSNDHFTSNSANMPSKNNSPSQTIHNAKNYNSSTIKRSPNVNSAVQNS